MHDLIQFPLTSQPSGIDDLIQKANDLMHSAKADSTRKAYRNDWRAFESWCQAHNLPSLPSTPQTIALYIADCVNHLAAATISRRLASISKAHQAAGFKDSPASTKHFVVGEVLKGARRELGVAQKGKDPLLLDDVRRIIAACPDNLLGLRDRALTLVGFAGAFRRSELVSIEVSDLTFSENTGLIIHLRHSKTDQEGEGCDVAIPFGAHEDPVADPLEGELLGRGGDADLVAGEVNTEERSEDRAGGTGRWGVEILVGWMAVAEVEEDGHGFPFVVKLLS